MLLADNEGTLQRAGSEFGRVCRRTEQRVSAGQSKVLVFERVREQVTDFLKMCGVRAEGTRKCRTG